MNTMRATRSNIKNKRLLYAGSGVLGTGSNGDHQGLTVAMSLVSMISPKPGGRATPRVCLYSPIIEGGSSEHFGLQHPGSHGCTIPSRESIHPQNVPVRLGKHVHLVSHITI
jgi:hypothetical protein